MDQWNYPRSAQQAGNQGYSSAYSAQQSATTSAANAAYGQQAYGHQQAYGQQAAGAYAGNSSVSSGGGSQLSSLQHPSQRAPLTRGGQQADPSAYLSTSAGATAGGGGSGTSAAALQYGGQYGSIYGSSTQSGAQQPTGASGKGGSASTFQGYGASGARAGAGGSFGGAASGVNASASHGLESSKYISTGSSTGFGGVKADYGSLSPRGYSKKGDQYAGGYPSAYLGRDIQSDAARRYPEAVGHPRQSDLQDQALLLRQQHVLAAQQLQSVAALRQGTTATALDAGGRAADYLPGRGSAMNPPQEYGAPMRVLVLIHRLLPLFLGILTA